MKDVPVRRHGIIDFEMAFGAGHSAQGEGLDLILNKFISIDFCLALKEGVGSDDVH